MGVPIDDTDTPRSRAAPCSLGACGNHGEADHWLGTLCYPCHASFAAYFADERFNGTSGTEAHMAVSREWATARRNQLRGAA